MGALDLTVRVSYVSPRASKTDLRAFFSYCGTVEDIKLDRDGDQTQEGHVTFRQPYAYQTALLLNGAELLGRPVRIMPLSNLHEVHWID